MVLDRIHLRKILKIMMLNEGPSSTAIRRDALDVMKVRDEGSSGGNDFYAPFWIAAKGHASGRSDLHDSARDHIERNWRRKSLYPRLRDGFLLWWNEKRRWINELTTEMPKTIKSSLGFVDIDGRVKVENLL